MASTSELRTENHRLREEALSWRARATNLEKQLARKDETILALAKKVEKLTKQNELLEKQTVKE